MTKFLWSQVKTFRLIHFPSQDLATRVGAYPSSTAASECGLLMGTRRAMHSTMLNSSDDQGIGCSTISSALTAIVCYNKNILFPIRSHTLKLIYLMRFSMSPPRERRYLKCLQEKKPEKSLRFRNASKASPQQTPGKLTRSSLYTLFFTNAPTVKLKMNGEPVYPPAALSDPRACPCS